MSNHPLPLPARPSLEHLQKQAKELLRQRRAADPAAMERFRLARPRAAEPEHASEPTLADAQFVVAREYGFETWAQLKHHVEFLQPAGLEHYEKFAKKLAEAFMDGNAQVVREINWNYGTSFVCDFHDPMQMQRRLPTWFASQTREPELALADARQIVAHSYGFEDWGKFAASVRQPPTDPRSSPFFMSSRPPFYEIDWLENRLSVRGPQPEDAWDTIIRVIREHGITKLSAGGMTDAGMERISRLEHLTHLNVSDSKGLTDEGAQHLARMPQLLELEIGGWTCILTDRAFEPLRYLKALRRLHTCWTQGITDAGIANLSPCQLLEDVNLLGTPTGDGAIQALAGKPHLRRLNTGRGVTDAGLKLLHHFPVFKTWKGGETRLSLLGPESEPNQLTIDGPFTDAGIASLMGLDGLFSLGFFWHCPAFTSAGLEPLRNLANLTVLSCDGKYCDDRAMRYVAALPHLRKFLGQGAVANDGGFAALSRSESIEYFWGRECPNLTGTGFVSFSTMPALRGIAVSCKRVDDAALATLPDFPLLQALMPMDVSDAGFRHVGRCEDLQELWCMYCRDIGDAATEHIAGLRRLRTYYAGMTQITDLSLETLSTIKSLERIEFWECAGLTEAGVARLAALPKLHELILSGLPGVSRHVLSLFPPHVRVKYSA